MSILRLRVFSLTWIVFFAVTFVAGPNVAQVLDVQEPGFTVTFLGSSAGPKGLRCSPGGVWGDYVYVSETGRRDRALRLRRQRHAVRHRTRLPGRDGLRPRRRRRLR